MAVTPFIWFNGQAEEAATLYASTFRNAKLNSVNRVGDAVQSASFEIDGVTFTAFNGGPHYTPNEAISFMVTCDDQDEIDAYWDALADGGKTLQCGWVTDRFGVTWQIVPKILFALLSDPDTEKAQRATQAMLGMVKLDITALKSAHAGA